MAGLILPLALQPDHQKSAEKVTEAAERRATEPARVAYSIAHALPGQVGFCVPRISQDPKYLRRLETLLREDSWVTSKGINTSAGSIVITYRQGLMSDFEMRSHLANLIQSAASEVVKPATLSPVKPADEEQSKPELISTSSSDSCPLISNGHFSAGGDISGEQSVEPSHKSVLPLSASPPQGATPPKKTKYPAKVAYSIAHAIPGRVRFRVPRIAQDPDYLKRLEQLLKADPQVTSERVNKAAVSIVITYKSSQKRTRNFLDEAILHLVSLIQSASDNLAFNSNGI